MPIDIEGLTAVANTENESRKMDVIFTHGLGGGSHSTWTFQGDSQNDEFFWPKELGDTNEQLGIWTIGYAAGFTNLGDPGMLIEKRARNIGIQLTNRGLGNRPVVFVTHGMGGLIVKSLIVANAVLNEEPQSKLVNRIHGVVFCGTPHRGSAFATAAGILAVVVGGAQQHVKEMEMNTERLDLDHDKFLAWQKRRPIMIETYAEGLPLKKKKRIGRPIPLGLVVPRASANPGIGAVKDVDADHLSLVKPSPNILPIYDMVFLGVKSFVESAIKWAPPSNWSTQVVDVAQRTIDAFSKDDSQRNDLGSAVGKFASSFFTTKPETSKDGEEEDDDPEEKQSAPND